MSGRSFILFLFTCNFPTSYARRPAHVELIDALFSCSGLLFFSLFPACSRFFRLVVAMLPPSLSLRGFFCRHFNSLLLFIFSFLSFWMGISTFLCLSVSSCANFSPWLSLILWLLLSLRLSPSLFACLPLVASYSYSLVILHSLLSLPLRTSF